ncbi:MAG: hypothetical protein PHQ36_01055 [Anaerolineales bacterium]|nr:hypothetical protein [Anaerolineales bacterium]
MKRRLIFGLLSILIIFSGAAFTRAPAPSSNDNPPPGPDRSAVVVVDYQEYVWRMATWEKQSLVCRIVIDHKGVPRPAEIYRNCGKTVFDKWVAQKPCQLKSKKACEGYYIHLLGVTDKQKEVPMDLPPAVAWISLEDCQPVPSVSTNTCETTPTLVITGQEPLPNESINRIEGTYDGEPFACDGADVCKFHIVETPAEGVTVQFWAYSTYGDSSVVYTAQVRALKADEGDPDQMYWYVDVLSSQWQGEVSATCAEAWEVFPPMRGVPDWLTTPRQSEELSSDIPYTYLAANLILQGAVDARGCPDGGIDAGGAANQCGVEKARPAVTDWQNQFDALILSVAQETSVPARLLKNLFARESQFWPGIYQSMEDAGLGQLTENGADTTLFWNDSFYEQFCPLVLPESSCENKYMNLREEDQIALRRALVSSVNATCEDCPLGLDLTQANFSVAVFAHSMTANCEQAGQVVYNYTKHQVSEVASYEDMWKFTLVNYNAGGGCLAEGVSNAYSRGLDLTWDNVSPYLVGACSGAVSYVNDISR